MDEFAALRIFRRVVELQSFAAAARDLKLSKAAVSKNVSDLEDQLNARLLNRSTRRMSLTEAGRFFYEHAVQVLDQMTLAQETIAEMQGTPSGTLRVGAPMSMGLLKLSPLLAPFIKTYPEIRLEIVMSDEIVNLIEEGYDVAIRGRARLEDSSLVARKFRSVRRVLCASPDYLRAVEPPRTPADLEHHSLLVYGGARDTVAWSLTQGEDTRIVTVEGRLTVNNTWALKEAVVAGAGVSAIPVAYVSDALTEGRLVEVLPEWKLQDYSLYVVYPSSQHVPPKVRAFVNFILEHWSD